MLVKILSIMVCVSVLAVNAAAEIYSYIDNKGVKVFVDNRERIPPHYQKSARLERNLPELQRVSVHRPAASSMAIEQQAKPKRTFLASAQAYFRKLLPSNEKREWKPTSSKAPARVPGQIPRKKTCGR